jgi:hypothetical protein
MTLGGTKALLQSLRKLHMQSLCSVQWLISSTSLRANLCIYTYHQLQTTGNSAVESFERQRKASLELFGLLMDISSSQLDLNTSTAIFPSPFPIIVLYLVLDAMISLEKLGSDMCLLKERQTFMDILQYFSGRWRLASNYGYL